MEKNEPLSKEDIKVLKYDIRPGVVTSAALILTWLIFFINSIKSDPKFEIIKIGFGTLLFVLIFSVFLFWLLTKDTFVDLKNGTKIIKLETIKHKEDEISWEAGSGNLYLVGWASLYPKFWGPKMKRIPKFNIIIGNHKYRLIKVDQMILKKGDVVEVHYASHSGKVLGIYYFPSPNLEINKNLLYEKHFA